MKMPGMQQQRQLWAQNPATHSLLLCYSSPFSEWVLPTCEKWQEQLPQHTLSVLYRYTGSNTALSAPIAHHQLFFPRNDELREYNPLPIHLLCICSFTCAHSTEVKFSQNSHRESVFASRLEEESVRPELSLIQTLPPGTCKRWGLISGSSLYNSHWQK